MLLHIPLPLPLLLFVLLPVDPANDATRGNPDQSGEDEDRSHDVALHDLHHVIRVQFLNDAVKSLDEVLFDFLAYSLGVAVAKGARNALAHDERLENDVIYVRRARAVVSLFATPFTNILGLGADAMDASADGAEIQAVSFLVALASLHARRSFRFVVGFAAFSGVAGTRGIADARGVVQILARAHGALWAEAAVHAAAAFVGRRADSVEFLVEFAFVRAARIVASDTGVAFLALFSLVIAAKGFRLGGEAVRRFRLQHGVDRAAAARREEAVVGLHAAHRIRVHDVGSALLGFGRAFGRVGVVFGTPIVAQFVRGDEVGFAREDASTGEVLGAAQARVEI